jgi:hypothetical protein
MKTISKSIVAAFLVCGSAATTLAHTEGKHCDGFSHSYQCERKDRDGQRLRDRNANGRNRTRNYDRNAGQDHNCIRDDYKELQWNRDAVGNGDRSAGKLEERQRDRNSQALVIFAMGRR